MFALVDSNNFYASCEQLFDPKVRGKPLVVLSSNDGCVIARSQEARDAGIPMGVAAYEVRGQLNQHCVIERSANFSLYGDMSERVIEAIRSVGYPFEIYSIDESFIDLSGVHDLETAASLLHTQVMRWTGIKNTVGIGPTKTLAKVANKWAKKRKLPYAIFRTEMLEKLPVEDIWGIGKALASFFRRSGIYTAAALIRCDSHWVKKNLSVTALRTVWELQGRSCLTLDETAERKKSIVSSRTFRRALTDIDKLKEAVAHFCALAATKLRAQGCVAGYIAVKIATNKHKMDYIKNASHMTLSTPTAYTPSLIKYAHQILEALYDPDIPYKRAAIMLADFSTKEAVQSNFFNGGEAEPVELNTLLDKVNKRWGRDTLFYAAEGLERNWKPASNHLSPKYTTQWSDIPRVRTE